MLSRVFARFRRRVPQTALADEIREELQFHLDARAEEHLRAGRSAGEARRLAEARVGSVERYVARGYAIRGDGLMRTMWQDVRFGARLWRRQPWLAGLAIGTLALGIGSATAIFSVIDAAVLRPLPYPHPEQLVELSVEVTQAGRTMWFSPSSADVATWEQASTPFRDIAMWNTQWPSPVVAAPVAERLDSLVVSEHYFALFGTRPVLGRGFTAGDRKPGAPAVAILGYAYWRDRFGGDPSVLGQPLRLDSGPATIVGVLPREFRPDVALWQPLVGPVNRASGTTTYARLPAGIDLAVAGQSLVPPLAASADADGVPSAGRAEPLVSQFAASSTLISEVLAGAVGLVLLIGCVNVAGLLLARGAARRFELAARRALGATRSRLVRQLLTESLLLALVGGALGVLVAWALLDTLVANMPIALPPGRTVAIDGVVLAFSLGLAILASLSAGLLPALSVSRVAPAVVLARSRRVASGRFSRRGGQVLIAVEVAMGIVLLTGAVLMLRSFSRLASVDVGFDPARVMTVEVIPVDLNPGVLATYYPAFIDALRRVPGVEAAGAVDHAPLGASLSFTVVTLPGGRHAGVSVDNILPGYVDALGLALVAGRDLTRADVRPDGPVLINEAAAKAWFPDGPAVGQRVSVGMTPAGGSPPRVIAGVIGDMRRVPSAAAARATAYLPFTVDASGPMPTFRRRMALTVLVRPREGVRVPGAEIKRVAESIGPPVVVERIRSGADWFADRVATPRQRTVLLSLLGGAGLLLALIGIFGTTAYAVTRRAQEIGVRVAFGARPAQVVGAIVRDAAWPVGLGLTVGIGGAVLATRLIASFLYETQPTDLPTFTIAAVVLAASALLAAWIPARRAARVDPIAVLRTE